MKRSTLVLAFFAVFAFSVFAQAPSEIKGGTLNGRAMVLPKPEYPVSAREAGLEGTVYVDVVIDEAGNIISAAADDKPRKILKQGSDGETIEVEQPAADAQLRDAAVRAAWQAKFSPTLLSGVPVKVTGTIVYNFAAGDNALTVSRTANGGSIVTKPSNDKVVRGEVDGGVLNSKAIAMPAPTYPPAARAVKAQGAVSVQVTVDMAGNVTFASAVSGHPLLRAAAVKAAQEAKFSPMTHLGVTVRGTLTYNFVAPTEEN